MEARCGCKFYGLNGMFATGGIIRDKLMVVAACLPHVQASSVGQAELATVRLGLLLSRDFGVYNLHVFSDAAGEVSKLNSSF